MGEGIGDRFQKETRYTREDLGGRMLDWSSKPDVYKEYADARRISLPDFRGVKTAGVLETLARRRSIRHFAPEPLELEKLSFLLWASTGVRRVERGHSFRTAPSAGALYPIETYLAVDNVAGLAKGIYHYAIREHELEEIRPGDFGHDVTMAALNQKMCLDAAVVFIWTAVFQRSKWKYEQRAYRYIYMDAGHVGGNLALAAASIGLGTCQIGALFDGEVNRIVGVDGDEESVIYMSVVGHPPGMRPSGPGNPNPAGKGR
jgi:SagB-type dehydrogenase family enzyme